MLNKFKDVNEIFSILKKFFTKYVILIKHTKLRTMYSTYIYGFFTIELKNIHNLILTSKNLNSVLINLNFKQY